jgi:hypothetical protein
MFDSARRKVPVPRPRALAARPGHRGHARRKHGARPGQGPVGAAVAAWSAVTLVGSYELLMMIISGTRPLEVAADTPSRIVRRNWRRTRSRQLPQFRIYQ